MFSFSLIYSYCLKERTFRTLDFYRKHQDIITPAGLAFYQSQWDQSVSLTFHTLLGELNVYTLEQLPLLYDEQEVFL